MTIRLNKKHHLMMLQTLKFHKHTTWSVYTIFFVCLHFFRYSRFPDISNRSARSSMHCLLCKKSIEMNLSRKRDVQLEQSLTLERPGIFSELGKAQIMSLSCQIYCVQLDASVDDHHRLHGCHYHFSSHHCSYNHPRRTR